MTRCASCTKRQHLDMKCSYCEDAFCVSCLNYETHNCPNFNDMTTDKRAQLQARLFRDRTQSNKLVKI